MAKFILVSTFGVLFLVVASDNSVCPGGTCGGNYHWPQQKGDLNRSGFAPWSIPWGLRHLPVAWTWKDGEASVLRLTPLIDDRKNVFLASTDGRVIKFSVDGNQLWLHRSRCGGIPAVPGLVHGKIIFNTVGGCLTSLDMETGAVLWTTQLSKSTATDTAQIFIHRNVVLSAARSNDECRANNNAIFAIDATTGNHIWTNIFDYDLYNFQAVTPGDETFITMDHGGRLFRIDLMTGKVLWQSGMRPVDNTWFTTAAVVLGPTGLLYCVSNMGDKGGIIHAYRMDGTQVWTRDLEYSGNQAVAVGRLAGTEGFSVVLTEGDNPGLPAFFGWIHWAFYEKPFRFLCVLAATWLYILCCSCHRGQSACKTFQNLIVAGVICHVLFDVFVFSMHFASLNYSTHPVWPWPPKVLPQRVVALEAETGQLRWSYELPPLIRPSAEGDEELLVRRIFNTLVLRKYGESVCLPDSTAQPVIDGKGTAYIGYANGRLYAIHDDNGDGIVSSKEVESTFFGHAFQASQAMAPGMLAVVPCGGGLWVWKSEAEY